MGIELFLWIKIIHILAVISWMAGLLYLPRLFVYHSENSKDSLLNDTFKVMEHKLFRFIMSPAMMVVWISGLILFYNSGFQLWLILKFLLEYIFPYHFNIKEIIYHRFCIFSSFRSTRTLSASTVGLISSK